MDELTDVARISGMPELPRRSIFHALNQKAVARRYAKEHGTTYDALNLIVIHMGGGVSVGAHSHGKVVDVNNILDGEGCFSPERSGTVPVGDLVKMCFSGKYTEKEIYKKICGNGGFNAYLHTNDARVVEMMVKEGDEYAKLVEDAFYYQIAKDAGAMAAVLEGKVDAIILTGGIAYNPYTREILEKKIGFIAPITVYPGEDELLALAQGALRVMHGEGAAAGVLIFSKRSKTKNREAPRGLPVLLFWNFYKLVKLGSSPNFPAAACAFCQVCFCAAPGP